MKSMENFFSGNTQDTLKRVSLAGAIAFSPVISERIDAAEGVDGKDWTRGSEEFIQQARSGQGEVGGAYVHYEDGTGEWVGLGKRKDGARVVYKANESADKLIKRNPKEKRYDVICHGHTHSLDAGVEAGWFDKKQAEAMRRGDSTSVSIPPTAEDIDNFSDLAEGIFSQVMRPDDEAGYVQAVFTPTGVWYFSPADEEYLRKNFPSAIQLQKQFSEMELRVVDVIKTIDTHTLERLRRSFEKEYPEFYASTVEALSVSGFPQDAGNIVAAFLMNDSGISSDMLDLLGLASGDEELIRRFRLIVIQRGLRGIAQAGEVFVKASLAHAPQESDYDLLFSAYANAGWALRYVSAKGMKEEGPCGISMKK